MGRKIKAEENLGEHNKFSDDNIQRKLKNAIPLMRVHAIAFSDFHQKNFYRCFYDIYRKDKKIIN